MWQIAGKTCVITGASRGIGRATAVGLAARGARIVVAGRASDQRTETLDLLEGPGHSAVDIDLASLASVRIAAETIGEMGPLGAVIANAGVAGPGALTSDGHERAFAVNHLGHFLLTSLVSSQLGGGRLVVVSSNAHFDAPTWDSSGLSRRARLTGFEAYRRSKLANVLFVREAARRWSDITAVAVHPGMAATDIWSPLPQPVRWWMTRSMASPEEASAYVIRAVIAADLETGGYYDRDRLRSPSAVAQDSVGAGALWEVSERMVDR